MQQSFYLFTPTEIALYFYLLESANLRKWPDTFTCINRKVENDLGVSYKTLAAAKNRLRKTGLIDFKSKNGSKATTFSLTSGNFPKVEETSGNFPKVEETSGNSPKVGETSGNSPKVGETSGNFPKVGETSGNFPKVGETFGNFPKVGDEVSSSHNNEFDKENNIYNNINNNIYNIPPTPPEGGNEQEKLLLEKERALKALESELKKREEALAAREQSAGKPKKPPSKLHSEARKVFEEHYRAMFSLDYYWTPKDAGNMTSLLKKLKFQREQKDLATDDEGILVALKYLLGSIIDGWLLEHFNVANINSSFNDIVSRAKGRYLANKGGTLFSQQQAPPSRMDNLQQTGDEAAELALKILNGNG